MADYAATKDSPVSYKDETAMDQLPKELGKRIRKKRKEKKVSQDALALSCEMDRSYMGRIERGEVNITIEKLYRIAKILDCEPAELLPPLKIFNTPAA